MDIPDQLSHVPGYDKYRAWGDVFRSSRAIVPYKSNPSPHSPNFPKHCPFGPVTSTDDRSSFLRDLMICIPPLHARSRILRMGLNWGSWQVWRSGWIPLTVFVFWGRMCFRSTLIYYCIINILFGLFAFVACVACDYVDRQSWGNTTLDRLVSNSDQIWMANQGKPACWVRVPWVENKLISPKRGDLRISRGWIPCWDKLAIKPWAPGPWDGTGVGGQSPKRHGTEGRVIGVKLMPDQ
jgi:hypothetical protein